MQRVSHMEGDRDAINHAIFLVVMGVSGTGKSTLGAALSNTLKLPFIDGDDLHPLSNVAKMSRGEALTDEDRRPWLDRIRQTAVKRILDQLGIEPKPETKGVMKEGMPEGCGTQMPSVLLPEERHRPGIIVACSALKKTYRDILRGITRPSPSTYEDSPELDAVVIPTSFVFLKGSKEVLMDRMQKREGHFMKVEMLESQLSTLESPEGEPDVITVSIECPTEEQVRCVARAISVCSSR